MAVRPVSEDVNDGSYESSGVVCHLFKRRWLSQPEGRRMEAAEERKGEGTDEALGTKTEHCW